MERTIRLAFCSLAAAVSVVVMLLTGVVPIGTYALPAIAALPQIAVAVEFGRIWGWPVYAAVSLLSLFLAGDREAALWYILFFGCYAMVKAAIEQKTRKPLSVVLKFLFFNAAAVLEFLLAMWFLNVPASSYTVFGYSVPWLFLAAGNVFFLFYDYALSLLSATYCKRLHPHVKKWLKLR